MEVYQRWTLMFCVTWKPTVSFFINHLLIVFKTRKCFSDGLQLHFHIPMNQSPLAKHLRKHFLADCFSSLCLLNQF